METDHATSAALNGSTSLAQAMQAASLHDRNVVVPHPSGLPTTLSRSYTIANVPTDAFVQLFGDRIVVGLSQGAELTNNFGTYILCQPERNPTNPRQLDFHLSTLLGDRSNVALSVLARQLTESLHSGSVTGTLRTVILAVSLQRQSRPEPAVLKAIVQTLVRLVQEAQGLSKS